MHRSEPRRMLNALTQPDVQWTGRRIVSHIHEHGHSNKVSMKKKRKKKRKELGGRQIFVLERLELVTSAPRRLLWALGLVP